MPVKPHPTDPDKMVYASRQYDIPELQGVTTTKRPWVGLTEKETSGFTQHEMAVVKYVSKVLQEKNNG